MDLVLAYALGNWLPKLMVEAGYDLSTSLFFLLALNIGEMLVQLVVVIWLTVLI